LECNDVTGYDAFDYIGSHIAQLLAEGTLGEIEVVAKVLARWRRFWGQTPRDLLSRESIIGLFGEVWFFTEWLLPLNGAENILAWRGPYGATHDFQRTEYSVEVKTTTSARGHIHTIQSLEQLEPPEVGLLYLFSLRLREDASGSHSLPSLVSMCMDRLASSPAELSLFESALAEVGYLPSQASEYERIRFRIEEECLFRVDENFPRITKGTFHGGVPLGIERIQYSVNLNAFSHLCVARSPERNNILFLHAGNTQELAY
jgi:hypothetical protein